MNEWWIIKTTPINYENILREWSKIKLELAVKLKNRRRFPTAKRFKFNWKGTILVVTFISKTEKAIEDTD